MTEKFELKGYWHLPSKPDENTAGILTYIPRESIKLELIGCFNRDKGSVEGYCTRFRKEKIKELKHDHKVSLKDLLNIIISEFQCIDKVKDDNISLKQVVDSRHYYSHFMEKSKKPHTLDGIELYDLTHKLRKLLICCILQFMGFEYKKINEIFNKSNSYILSRKNTQIKRWS